MPSERDKERLKEAIVAIVVATTAYAALCGLGWLLVEVAGMWFLYGLFGSLIAFGGMGLVIFVHNIIEDLTQNIWYTLIPLPVGFFFLVWFVFSFWVPFGRH